MAEFKKLSDVEVVEKPTESANVLIEENGVIKKAPKTAVGGGGHWVMLTDGSVVASEGIYEALDDFFVNPCVPLIISTHFVSKYSETGRVNEFSTHSAEYIGWYPDEGYFSVSGVNGIAFFIRKNGNHDYYWD